jgi:hypothetical protein
VGGLVQIFNYPKEKLNGLNSLSKCHKSLWLSMKDFLNHRTNGANFLNFGEPLLPRTVGKKFVHDQLLLIDIIPSFLQNGPSIYNTLCPGYLLLKCTIQLQCREIATRNSVIRKTIGDYSYQPTTAFVHERAEKIF